jgi:hypothetical protein
MGAIKKARDKYNHPDRSYEDATTVIEIMRDGGTSIPDPQADPPTTPAVVARINYGRWIGDCGLTRTSGPLAGEVCRNAQVVDDDDPRFFCVDCANEELSGVWREVTFPADLVAVEAPLDELPEPEQNWEP